MAVQLALVITQHTRDHRLLEGLIGYLDSRNSLKKKIQF